MALVLYHVEDAAKEKQLSALCRELHLTARRLTNADRDRAVAALCGEKVNAVRTEHNDKWSLYALCEELRREHAAMLLRGSFGK